MIAEDGRHGTEIRDRNGKGDLQQQESTAYQELKQGVEEASC